MGARLRQTRRRIRSVQSTMRITRAMELIAASRIVKAQQRVQRSRPYAERLTATLQNVASQADSLEHPMLEQRPERRAAAVFVVTSDRGLAGAYNANVLRTTEELLAKLRSDGVEPKLFVTGKKGLSYFRFRGREIEAGWQGFSESPTYDDAKAVADALIAAFEGHDADEIHGVFTNYVSALTQRAAARRFVPLLVEEVAEAPPGPIPQYLFEPDAAAILNHLVPRYVESRVFLAMLEAAASEQAARRRAMSAATENAEELIKILTRQANQARQGEITQEISEIVGGAEALQKTGS
ncbi:MAG TPA: F0F1 ATP synthase subunit gamma [Actinomycetota bacterium]|nr:F0F1 ATP synthase subunit gamma [Actinomycetota bacterium]